ncbi:MAG: hypothetical protein ACLQPD_35705 [Desulfomonilaceae bacterium]
MGYISSELSTRQNCMWYWQRYLGYPIIAGLMVLGRLDFNSKVAQALSRIAWKQTNRRFRNDYDKAVESVLLNLDVESGLRQKVTSEVDKIFAQLQTLGLKALPRRRRPPKGS